MDHYRIPVPNGRAVEIGADQLRRMARGLGDHLDAPPISGQEPPIIRALCSLPISQRAEVLSVALRRFGEKQDVETISQACGLTPWRVWQHVEAFRRAVAEAQASQVGSSDTASLGSCEMPGGASGYQERGDLRREHERAFR